jgi:hypothetical protein
MKESYGERASAPRPCTMREEFTRALNERVAGTLLQDGREVAKIRALHRWRGAPPEGRPPWRRRPVG